ncbi:MAG: CapA family protein [Clostridia bacterium]|nr:CapA family protein [Clostridia bacterium]
MRLIICSDTVPTEASERAFREGDVQALFSDVLPVFQGADRVLVNLECALTDTNGAIMKFGPNLKGPIESAKTLKKAGVTDCGLSNNHVYDFNTEGLRDTIRLIKEAGLNATGVGKNEKDSRKPLVMQAGDKTVAVIAVCEHEYSYALENRSGSRPFDPFETLTDVYDAKRKYDYVVVTYHGGKEHCRYPSPRLMRACRAMVHLGADAVLCQHSHIIGCMEYYEGKPIVYGTGNFHFLEYSDEPSWNEGLMAALDFKENGEGFSFELIPVVSTDTGIRLAGALEKQVIMEDMEKRNQSLADGTWIDGWRDFCKSVQKLYEDSVYNCIGGETDPRLRQHFAHYLDCEAHTDVYRELFRTWHLD